MGARRTLLTLLSAVVAVLAYARLIRPWHLTWGATPDEVRQPMRGDDRIPHPGVSATRAITIAAPPEDVWPWLVQMGGYDRAGWYSYDRIDNAGVPSADEIIPELQALSVGDVMRTSPSAGFVVEEIEPGRSMVLAIAHDGSQITFVPLVTELPDGRSRLVFRIRAHFRPRHYPFWALFDFGDFLFMRKQMLGIKQRAERHRSPGPEHRRAPRPAPGN